MNKLTNGDFTDYLKSGLEPPRVPLADLLGYSQTNPNRITWNEVQDLMHELTYTRTSGLGFFTGPPGTGKSTGMFLAIPWMLDMGTTIAIAVPTCAHVEETRDSIREAIAAHRSIPIDQVGPDVIQRWTSAHQNGFDDAGNEYEFVDKENIGNPKVFVGTHQFLLSHDNDPQDKIGNCDLLIIDERETPRIVVISASTIVQAMEEANRFAGYKFCEMFNDAAEWANGKFDKDVPKQHSVYQAVRRQMNNLTAIKFSLYDLPVNRSGAMRDVVEFFSCVENDRAFARTINKQGAEGMKEHNLVGFRDTTPFFDRRLILSATAIYEGYKPLMDDSQTLWREGVIVDYSDVDISYFSYHPNAARMVIDLIGDNPHRKHMLAVVDRMLAEVVRKDGLKKLTDVLIVGPKAITSLLENHLKLNPVRGLSLSFLNYGRGIGQNEWSGHDAVLLLSNPYRPTYVVAAEFLQISGQEANRDTLKPIKGNNNHSPAFKEYCHNQYLRATMQYAMRIRMRGIDDDCKANQAQILVWNHDLSADDIQGLWPEASMTVIEDYWNEDGFPLPPSRRSRAKKGLRSNDALRGILSTLNGHSEDVVTISELEKAENGPRNLRQYLTKFEARQPELGDHGWQFVRGTPHSKKDVNRFERLLAE